MDEITFTYPGVFCQVHFFKNYISMLRFMLQHRKIPLMDFTACCVKDRLWALLSPNLEDHHPEFSWIFRKDYKNERLPISDLYKIDTFMNPQKVIWTTDSKQPVTGEIMRIGLCYMIYHHDK